MSSYRKIFNKILTASLFISVFLSFSNQVAAQDGEALFKANCSSCHKPLEKFTGPALQGIRTKIPKGKWVYEWVANSTALFEAGDPEAKRIRAEYQNQQMTAFHDQLKPADIDAILNYVDAYKEAPAAPGQSSTEGGGSSDNNLLYGLLTIILAIIAFILLQVNSNLRKLTDDKEGVIRSEPVPFYRNMTYLMMGVVVLFVVGGYFLVQWGIGLGRSKGFQPEQPIYYSHQVHAGTNQISCLYCHGGAQDSKHANIPSVNVCMNCHRSISEYKGKDVLVRENGVGVNGTEEIQKLYEYAGWNPATKSYNADKNGDGQPDGAHPISWTRIHNLPDHVYFNHSQHVKVGKQQCQTCHGPITEMPEVKQFADLSMGWCINCHRNTKVDFPDSAGVGGNKFYNVYEKFHRDMKAGKMDSVTVEKIGGLECQKCHY
jgi:cytochrome c2